MGLLCSRQILFRTTLDWSGGKKKEKERCQFAEEFYVLKVRYVRMERWPNITCFEFGYLGLQQWADVSRWKKRSNQNSFSFHFNQIFYILFLLHNKKTTLCGKGNENRMPHPVRTEWSIFFFSLIKMELDILLPSDARSSASTLVEVPGTGVLALCAPSCWTACSRASF